MALGGQTVQLFSSAVQDIFSIGAYEAKAKGQRLEAEQYDIASAAARHNAVLAGVSTEIRTAQQQRSFLKTMGAQQAGVAFAGFGAGGTALDLLRESTAQGALEKGVLEQQGLIEAESYEVQAKSYDLMAQASRLSAEASEEAADNAWWTAGLKGTAAVATLFT